MLYQVIEDGEITESYAMPDHDDTHHKVTAGNRQNFTIANTDITLTQADFTIFADASAGARTITLPSAAPHINRIYNIKKVDASVNTVTIDGDGGQTIDGSATQVISTQYNSYTIQSYGSGWFIIGKVS